MIEIENVSFQYKGSNQRNLRNVNIKIQNGECVLLAGKSGCGKTTALRLMNGLIPHYYEGQYDGETTLDGRSLDSMKMYEIAENIGTIYQNPRSQFFNIDSDSEILFGIENMAYPRDRLRERFLQTVEETGVQQLLNRNLFHMSGGEKQKVAFASVYAMQPEVYLLDEPSSNLDAKAIRHLRGQIAELKRQGKTIVITEHRLYYLRDLVDRVILMEHGQVKAQIPGKKFFSMEEDKRIAYGLRMLDSEHSLPMSFQRHSECQKLLCFDHVFAGYKKTTVLKDISFKVAKGEIIGIIGHNGAGKSTLSELICGVNKVEKGSITYCGKPISEKERCRLSYMVFQDVDYELFADSVKNECQYGVRGMQEETVTDVLSQLGLLELQDVHPALLSGGQKQRLAVAVSIICKKEILVFDEPTSGLDYESMIRVSSLLSRLSQEGKIIFVVTHDYELVCNTCHRLLVVDHGRLSNDIHINNTNQRLVQNLML